MSERGYERELNPLPGEEELDALSGLADLVEPFIISGVTANMAAGATSAFVASRNGKGREGLLVAFGWDISSEDPSTSPVTLQQVVRAPDTGNVQIQSLLLTRGCNPMSVPVGSLQQPFVVPYPFRIPLDREAALVVKNNTAAPMTASGMLYGLSWSYEQNRDVRRAMFGVQLRGGSLWPKMFGGKR
jgi:hypothetical protein